MGGLENGLRSTLASPLRCAMVRFFHQGEEILTNSDTAFVTILNGVLLDVMPAITASFSLAVLSQIPEERRRSGVLAELIEFGFAHSGYSFQEKVGLYCERYGHLVNVERVLKVYNFLRSSLTENTAPAVGMVSLLAHLRKRGIFTFVTSVVPQHDLQSQVASAAHGAFVPFLTEALGEQDGYKKLSGHLSLIKKRYPQVKRFYLLFDAPHEIRLGVEARSLFPVRVAGIVHPLQSEVVASLVEKRGAELLEPILPFHHRIVDELSLQGPEEQRLSLEREGAEAVIVHEGEGTSSLLLQDVDLYLSKNTRA